MMILKINPDEIVISPEEFYDEIANQILCKK